MSEIKEEVKAPVRVHKERSEENINISHISPSAAISYFTKMIYYSLYGVCSEIKQGWIITVPWYSGPYSVLGKPNDNKIIKRTKEFLDICSSLKQMRSSEWINVQLQFNFWSITI